MKLGGVGSNSTEKTLILEKVSLQHTHAINTQFPHPFFFLIKRDYGSNVATVLTTVLISETKH